MSKERTTKEIAGRIEPTYHRRMHALRKVRFLLSAGVCALGLLWIAFGGEGVHANGAVAAAHASFGGDCAQCHDGGFQAVSDERCTACHAAAAHADEPAPACVHCHREHRGRTGLSVVSDAHCAGCHGKHRAIADFASHVEFAPKPREQRLRFNHRKHLDPKLQEGPLACADCHVARAGGHEPIAFETHCARCHTERIDEEFPEETVPHGFQPAALRDWVGAVYLRHGVRDLERTERATAALFDPQRERGCLLCHTMVDGAIEKPDVPSQWYTRARFDHHPHRGQACADCHEMEASTRADDLKLPGVSTCRECHGPERAPSTCTTCHRYHGSIASGR